MNTNPNELTFEAGDIIYEEGDRDGRLYLLIEGEVHLHQRREDGNTLLAKTLGERSVLGGMAFLDGSRKTSDAVARTPVRCMVIDQSGRSKIMNGLPAWLRLVIRDLVSHIRSIHSDLILGKKRYESLQVEYRRMLDERKKLRRQIRLIQKRS